jgi:ribosomal protein L11 methyltransferase
MDYSCVHLSQTKGQNALLIALLDNLGYDSFEESDEGHLIAYIPSAAFNREELLNMLLPLPDLKEVEFEVKTLENKNWNEEWEQNFKSILVGKDCAVRAPFHPKGNEKFDLVIEPKMAFGTGHHATTFMMLDFMLGMDFENAKVLDFGCGTGILSLLAEMKGAANIQANDIEEAACINAKENASLNNCSKIIVHEGGMEVVPKHNYDIILANITTNVIKENLPHLLPLLKPGGHLLMSGILDNQEDQIVSLAEDLKLTKIGYKHKENWIALHYQK